MPSQAGTIEQVALAIGRALVPLHTRLSPENALALFAELGIQFPPALVAQPAFASALSNASSAAGDLLAALTDLTSAITADDAAEIAVRSVELIAKIAGLINALDTVSTQLDAAAGSMPEIPPSVVSDFASNLGSKLVEFTLVSALENAQSEVARILPWTGIIDRVPNPGVSADATRPPFIERKLHLTRLVHMLQNPAQLASNLYGGWGTLSFDGAALLTKLDQLLRQTGASTTLTPAPPAIPISLSTEAFTIQPNLATTPAGLIVDVGLGAPGGLDFPWRVSDDWTLHFRLTPTIDSGLQITISPPASFAFQSPSGPISGEGSFDVVGERQSPAAFVLIGQTEGSRLQVRRVRGGVGLRFSTSPGSTSEPIVQFEAADGKAIIDTSTGDSLINSLMPGGKGEVNFEIGGRWTPSEGVSFHGSASLEIAIPTHVDLGLVQFLSTYIIIGLEEGGSIPIELSVAITSKLGPLEVAIDRIGLLTHVSFPSGGGNLGPADLDLSFKPPNGVGLSIDAGVVKGGGYLRFDFDKEEYSGALELVFSEFLTLKAIGLITTRMPDGSKGFSLLIIITAEFGSPIQLGLGFTLIGVGGLLGLNRTMRLEAIAEGVRTGAIESIMFPKDVIANAPRIISDLREFFPPEEGTFLIGPMAKLGWGTPTLVTASLGIIIEIPPGNIAILGVLKVVLPDEDAALIRLQVNFAGALEVDKKRLWFSAALYESRVVFMTIEGEMGLLVAWGGDANFVVSVGGFHPSFNPPPLPFSTPKRVSVNILDSPLRKLRVEGYFAVTSNTVQFGARVEVLFGLSDFGINGHIGFDALFQFSPFYFIISISASLGVKVFGIGLFSVHIRGELEGTSPWHIEGEGSISLLFWSIDVPFSHTWGQDEDTTLPPIQVMGILETEFNKLDNWTAEIPSSNKLLVSLRKIESTEDLVLHPVGVLRVSQRAVPLDLSLDKVGNQKPSDVKKVVVDVAGADLQKHRDTREQFAIAQFKELSDSGKLSSPAYEKQKAGLELSVAGEQLNSDAAAKRVVRYEEIIIDSNFKEHLKRFVVFALNLFAHFLRGNAASRSQLSATYKHQIAPIDQKVTVEPPAYVVASNTDNSAFSEDAMFASQAQANDFMQEQISKDAKLAQSLHVIPVTEMKEAA